MSNQKLDNNQQKHTEQQSQRLKEIYDAIRSYKRTQYHYMPDYSLIIQALKDFIQERNPILAIRTLLPNGDQTVFLGENGRTELQFHRLLKIHNGLKLPLNLASLNFYAVFDETLKAIIEKTLDPDVLEYLGAYVAAHCDEMSMQPRHANPCKQNDRITNRKPQNTAQKTIRESAGILEIFSMFSQVTTNVINEQMGPSRVGYTEIK